MMAQPLLLTSMILALKRRSGRTAHDLLPPELWNLILDDLTDNGLLHIARVCSTLNAIALPLYLRRNKVDTSLGAVTVPPHVLPALYIACVPWEIRSLTCKLAAYDVLRSMRLLRALVMDCSALTTLRLEWSSSLNILRFRRYHFGFRERKIPYSELVVTTLLDLLYVAAARTPGPLILVANGEIYKFKSSNSLRNWKLCDFTPPRPRTDLFDPILTKLGFTRKVDQTQPPNPHISIPTSDGASSPVFRLDFVSAVHIQPLHIDFSSKSGMRSVTLLVFDMPHLTLCHSNGLAPEELSSILSHLHIPSLNTLRVEVPLPAPILEEFLGRHRYVSLDPTVGTI